MKKYFYNPNDSTNSAQLAAMTRWFDDFLAKNGDKFDFPKLDTGGGAFFDFSLVVEEQHCGDSGCLHSETLLTARFLDESGNTETHYFRIKKPLVFIRKFDFDHLQPLESAQSGAHRH